MLIGAKNYKLSIVSAFWTNANTSTCCLALHMLSALMRDSMLSVCSSEMHRLLDTPMNAKYPSSIDMEHSLACRKRLHLTRTHAHHRVSSEHRQHAQCETSEIFSFHFGFRLNWNESFQRGRLVDIFVCG